MPKCKCVPPFIGNPYMDGCEAECIVNHDCDNHLACFNQHCRDPCPGVCGSNAKCEVVEHVPVCSCLPGYTGDPFGSCKVEKPREFSCLSNRISLDFIRTVEMKISIDSSSSSTAESLHAIALRTTQYLSRDERSCSLLVQSRIPRITAILSSRMSSQLGVPCTLGLYRAKVRRSLPRSLWTECFVPGHQSQPYLQLSSGLPR